MAGKPGRPPKEPGERMTIPLRIMLTASQDELIRQAAAGDVSGWARPILLQAARSKTGSENGKKRQTRQLVEDSDRKPAVFD